MALPLRHYNERHDAVLEVLATFFAGTLPEGYMFIADLPQFLPYLFPPHIAHTDDRPDMVVWIDNIWEVWVIEPMVCFETIYEEAHMRKTTRYADLTKQIVDFGFDGELCSDTGSWEPWFPGTLSSHHTPATALQCTKKQWRTLLNSISQAAIKGLHKIWVMRNWTEPPQ